MALGMVLIFMALLGGGLLLKASVSWFSYVLVLVFLGGVIVIIIYMSTLTSSEKFYFNTSPIIVSLCTVILIRGLGLLKFKFLGEKVAKEAVVRGALYESSLTTRLFFLMVYLLLTIVCVVKLVKFEAGPLVARL